MDKKTLNELLEKYYRGETDIREEKILQYHFSLQDHHSYEHDTDKLLVKLTQAYKERQNVTSDIEGNIAAYIDERLDDSVVKRFRKSFNRYAIAASIAILAGLSVFMVYRYYNNKPADTYSDPYIAYEEAKKALMYVSGKLNTGMEPLSNINKIQKGTEPLNSLNTIEKNLEMVGFFTFVNQTSSLK